VHRRLREVVACAVGIAALTAPCPAVPARAAELYPVLGIGVRDDGADDDREPPTASPVVHAPFLALPSLDDLGASETMPAPELGHAAALGRRLGARSALTTPPLAASFPAPLGGTPPDPVIAAGPEALLAVTNGGLALLSKTGASLDQSFPDGFDPKVLFDPHSQRFFALALEGRSSPFSELRIRVSKSSTPTNLSTGASVQDHWWAYVIDADLDGGMQINDAWADFPSLGIDQHNLYVASGMIPNGGGAWAYVKVWIIPKAGLISGGPITVYEFGAPPGPVFAHPVTGTRDYWIAASINFDAAAEHLVATPRESVGAFGRSTLWTVNDPGGTPSLSSSDLLLPGWTGAGYPPCPQLGGGAPIDSGFIGTPHIAERDGSLWMSHTSPDGTGLSEIHWYEIDPTGPTVLQSGQIGDTDRCYFYSAIQPDAQGNVAVVMSGAGPTIYPSAFYAVRRAGDPPGTMRPVAELRAGLGSYDQVFNGRNRWGDYGGIASDPVSDMIWMFHEYATELFYSAENWIGGVSLALPVETGSFVLGRAVLRATTRAAERGNGAISLRGFLDANDLSGALSEALAAGLVVRVGGAGLPEAESIEFTPGECVQSRSVLRCDGNEARAWFRPMKLAPNLFRVSVRAKRRAFPPPLRAEEVIGSLAFADAERQDRIGNCRLGGHLDHVVRCREAGVVLTTPTAVATPTVTPTAIATATATLTPTFGGCGGDCDGNEAVFINELIVGINMLLGSASIAACPAGDIDGDGGITVDELVAAAGNANFGCGTHPTGPAATGPVRIELGIVGGSAGATVTFDARLRTMGETVAGVQTDITFSASAPIAVRSNGRPDCTANPAINKGGTSYAFQPPGCTFGVDCTGIRSVVFALDNFAPIPDGSVLYTCSVWVSSSAADGTYPLMTSNVGASAPGGRPIPAFGIDGAVVVGIVGTPTLTPTPTHTGTATASFTPTS